MLDDQDLNEIVVEVEEMFETINAVAAAASQVSERVAVLASTFDGVAAKLLKGTEFIVNTTARTQGIGSAMRVGGIGLMAAGAAKAVGYGIEVIGGGIAEKKEKEARAKQLALKRDIASAKRETVNHSLQRMKRMQGQLKKLVDLELTRKFSIDNLERSESTTRSLEKVFNAWLKSKITVAFSHYLSKEFDAWLAGEQHSSEREPQLEEILLNAVNHAINRTEFDELYEGTTSEIPQGAILLLRTGEYFEEAQHDPEVRNFLKRVSKKWVLSHFLPFGKFKRFRQQFSLMFPATSPVGRFATNAMHETQMYLAFSTVILGLVGLLGFVYSTKISERNEDAKSSEVFRENREQQVGVLTDAAANPAAAPSKRDITTENSESQGINFSPTATPTKFRDFDSLEPFMSVICEGEFSATQCNECPIWTQAEKTSGPFTLEAAYLGNFSGNGPELFLSFGGCAGFNFQGMTALFGHGKDGWRLLATDHELDLRECKIESSGRSNRLNCIRYVIGGGDSEASTYVVGVMDEKPAVDW